jgi:hypothetical protein
VSLDVALRGEFFFPLQLDGEVNVRGQATGVLYGLDRAEKVFAGRAGQKAAEPLKVGVSFIPVAAAGMEIGGVVVDLPDFDQGVPERVATAVKDAPAQIGDLADRRGKPVVDDQQVIVGVERHLVRIEWPLGLRWGLHQLLSKRAGRHQSGDADCPDRRAAQEMPAGVNPLGCFHGLKSPGRAVNLRLGNAIQSISQTPSTDHRFRCRLTSLLT